MSEVTFVNNRCQACGRYLQNGDMYYQHKKKGIVCHYCPEFEDGGIKVIHDPEPQKKWYELWFEAIRKAEGQDKVMAILVGWVFALTAHKDD